MFSNGRENLALCDNLRGREILAIDVRVGIPLELVDVEMAVAVRATVAGDPCNQLARAPPPAASKSLLPHGTLVLEGYWWVECEPVCEPADDIEIPFKVLECLRLRNGVPTSDS